LQVIRSLAETHSLPRSLFRVRLLALSCVFLRVWPGKPGRKSPETGKKNGLEFLRKLKAVKDLGKHYPTLIQNGG
jgi:hypothetical protein